jgi:inosine-uridine nucleoside N-ribohydrolase
MVVLALQCTDTYQGIDDILALLLALSSKPEELEVLLISLTFGNIEVNK